MNFYSYFSWCKISATQCATTL